MTERTSYEPGVPCWVDVMTPSRDAAKAFYGGLFGWTFEDQVQDGAIVYTQCFSGGHNVAGMGEMSQEMSAGGMPPSWSTYVATTDVDETTRKVEAAGGTVIMPAMQIFDAGRMAMYQDPAGAMIHVWEAGSHLGAALVNEPYGFTWNELQTRDVPGAIRFYEAVFGWKAVTHEGEMPYTEFQLGAASIAGMMGMPPMVPAEVPANWLTYFAVEEADATLTKLGELGGTMIMPPMDIDVGRFAVVADPHGAVFAVMQLKETQ